MTELQKERFIIDLSARVPYRTLVKAVDPINGVDITYYLTSVYKDNVQVETDSGGIMACSIEAIRPILRYLDDITEEERKEFESLCINGIITWKAADYLNKIHVDYRGLGDMGLAINVTKENNPY